MGVVQHSTVVQHLQQSQIHMVKVSSRGLQLKTEQIGTLLELKSF